MERDDKFVSLMAKSLAHMNADDLRTIVGEAVRKRIENYDMGDLIREMVAPLVRTMFAELLKDPAILEMLQGRVRQQAMALTGKLELSVPRY